MLNYLIRRLILLPITLFFIILVNFVIINLAPGDPVTVTELSPEGAAVRRQDQSVAFGSDDRYLQFREFYGLTLPILFNTWPWITSDEVKTRLRQLVHRKESPDAAEEMNFKEYDQIRIQFGDQARFIMPQLLRIINDPNEPKDIRGMASRFFARGGTRQGIVGPNLDEEQKQYNSQTAKDNLLLKGLVILPADDESAVKKKIDAMNAWYKKNDANGRFSPDFSQKIRIFFFETRFFRYISRVATLDFGTLRNDANKTVISEVTKRFKYSLTLAILPMFITFVFAKFSASRWPIESKQMARFFPERGFSDPLRDTGFCRRSFLIENVALNNTFPFTDVPIPISGFTSPDRIYDQLTSFQRLADILRHICLPLVAVMYGSLAAESRLSPHGCPGGLQAGLCPDRMGQRRFQKGRSY